MDRPRPFRLNAILPDRGIPVMWTKRSPSPLEVAVRKDDLRRCKTILADTTDTSDQPPCTHDTIRLACENDSSKCLAYLLEKYPETRHIQPGAGPSVFVLALNKSLETSRTLLQYGKPWTTNDLVREHDGQTILHMIYRHAHCSWMRELTELVFSCGYDKCNVNLVNTSGVSALHILVGNIFRKPAPESESGNRPEVTDSEVADCIIETLDLLISCGVDLHACDGLGRGVVHYLIMNACKMSNDSGSKFVKPLAPMNKVLLHLMEKGVDINTSNLPSTSTPFTWLTSLFSESNIFEIDKVWEDVYETYRIMCDYGADTNVYDTKGISPVSLILTACNRWLRQTVSEQNILGACQYITRVKSLMYLFLSHGYNPTPDTFDFYLKQVAILLNIVDYDMDLGPLLRCLRDLILPFFLHGYNPNTLQMVTKRERENEVCSLHARFYISRSFIIHRPSGAAYEFLSLFQNCLDQRNFYMFIDSVCHIIVNDFPHIPSEENRELVSELTSLTKTPKSLKSLCRISVANSLGWKLIQKVDFLPLPSLIKRYLLEF